jgi:hypothetical protein
LRCYLSNPSRTVNAALSIIRHQGVDLVSSGITYSPGGGFHITDCEFLGNANDYSMLESPLLIHTIDGLYVANTHFAYYVIGVDFQPLGTIANNNVIDCYFDSNCYFDQTHNVSSYNVRIGGTINYLDATHKGHYQNIRFSNTLLRGSDAANNCCLISIIDGGAFNTNSRKVRNIKFDNCNIQSAKNTAISILGSGSSKIEPYGVGINGCNFSLNNFSGTSNPSCIYSESENISITSCEFDEDYSASTNVISVIMTLLQSNAPSFLCNGNDFSRVNCTDTPVQYSDIAGALTNISDNIYPGKGQEVDQVFKTVTTDGAPKIMWSQSIAEGQTGFVRTRTVGANSTAAERSRYEHHANFFRQSAGTLSIAVVEDSVNQIITGSEVSVMLAALTGISWGASDVRAGGVLLTSGGYLYQVLQGGTTGTVAPTHTSGTATNGTCTLGYVAVTAANTLALIVSGTAATTINWCADIEFMAVP